MCRHLIPRLDLPIAQAVHAVGRLVAAHPAMTVLALVVPVSVVIAVMARHRFHWAAVSHVGSVCTDHPQRIEALARMTGAPIRLRIAHQG